MTKSHKECPCRTAQFAQLPVRVVRHTAKAALEAAEAEALAVRRGEEPQPTRVLEALLDAATTTTTITTSATSNGATAATTAAAATAAVAATAATAAATATRAGDGA